MSVMALVLILPILGLYIDRVWKKITSSNQAQEASTGLKVVRASEFILESENGKPRAGLSAFEDGAALFLIDENGKTRVALAINGQRTGLVLSDENGKLRVGLSVSETGSSLGLCDENGKVIWSAPK